MKIAKLQTDQGVTLAGVDDSGENVQFYDLGSSCLVDLISSNDGLAKAQAAMETAKASGQTISGTVLAPIGRPGKVI